MFVGDLLRDLAVLASGDRWHEDTVRGTCRRQVLPGHQFALVPIIGRSFDRSYVYIGGGPTLSLTRGKFNSLVGFARIFGERADISGPPTDLSSSNWVWGGTGTIGATWFFDRSWFLDVYYSYSNTSKQTSKYFATFVNPNQTFDTPTGPVIGTTVGTLNGTSSGRVITQGITFTIGRSERHV
jgi:hypothetical protein